MFGCEAFRTHVRDVYQIDMDDFDAELTGVDHHRWFELLAARAPGRCSRLVGEGTRGARRRS